MEKSPIIFLDIDGVLNTEWYYELMVRQDIPTTDQYGLLFDPSAVECLGEIIQATGAKIIITSTWREEGTEWLREMWQSRRLPGEIMGRTPVVTWHELNIGHKPGPGIRGTEIQRWLNQHNYTTEPYVIIDDIDDFLPHQLHHVVTTNPHYGITEEIAAKAIEILLEVK